MSAQRVTESGFRIRPNTGSLRQRIEAMWRPFLFTDFDGTLAPIVPVPGLAVMAAEIKTALQALSRSGVTVAVISGRAVEDMQRRVGLPVICAGNHGLEIRGPGLEYTEPAAYRLRLELLTLCNELRAALEPYSAALVECKGLTASVHYRQVRRRDVPAIAREVLSVVATHPPFRVSEGWEVFDIRPGVPWNKGSAARWILDRVGGAAGNTVTIGDDSTDEDMFAAVADGITVRVGMSGPTTAQYRIPQDEVRPFLEMMRESVR